MLFSRSNYYQGPKSEHFDGERFHNQVNDHKKIWHVLKWYFTREYGKWPSKVDVLSIENLLIRNFNGALITYIGHSTVLIQINGKNIITDPVWADRPSPFSWLGPKRIDKPPIQIRDLPKIDLILLSHNHYDHMDIKALKEIQQLFDTKIITGLGNDSYLAKHNIESFALDWWNSVDFDDLNITFVPSQHWSARGLFDRNKTLWGGFIISKGKFGEIYFAGDTGYSKYFKEISSKFKNIKLALLPIGAYKPRWFMKGSHIDPEEAVIAATDLNSKKNMAIHFNTFKHLADDGYDEAVKDLKIALKKHQKTSKWFEVINPGNSIQIN